MAAPRCAGLVPPGGRAPACLTARPGKACPARARLAARQPADGERPVPRAPAPTARGRACAGGSGRDGRPRAGTARGTPRRRPGTLPAAPERGGATAYGRPHAGVPARAGAAGRRADGHQAAVVAAAGPPCVTGLARRSRSCYRFPVDRAERWAGPHASGSGRVHDRLFTDPAWPASPARPARDARPACRRAGAGPVARPSRPGRPAVTGAGPQVSSGSMVDKS